MARPERALSVVDLALERTVGTVPPTVAGGAELPADDVELDDQLEALMRTLPDLAPAAKARLLRELGPHLARVLPRDSEIQRRNIVASFAREAARREAEAWPAPDELPGLPPVPSWNDALLPEALRPWLADVAERAQCPPEYAAAAAVVALASVIGRGCAIRPKRRDDWTVVPNVWGAVVGPPSSMKTPALREAMRPVLTLAAETSKRYAAQQYERDALEAERAALKDEMRKLARAGEDPVSLRDRYEALESRATSHAERRYVVYDTTAEKLGEILGSSPRGVLLHRDELVGWLASLDRIGHECDRALYLEAWNGDGSFVFDRIARGTVQIDAACVSIIGGIQPGPLARYLRAALDGGAGADGLMQRFQLLVYPDPPRAWRNVDRWPDTAARDRALEVFRRLADFGPGDIDADATDSIPFLRFSNDAQEFFDAWRAELETRLRAGVEHEALEAHLAKYRSLMPSLALIFALVDEGHGPVNLHAAQRAAAWTELLETHARRLYATVVQADVGAARALLAKLRAGKLVSPFSPRDVYRHEWSGLADAQTVDAALALLEQYGWVRMETVRAGAAGGRPSIAVTVHPSIVESTR
jgi:putative DNA primase/helicase